MGKNRKTIILLALIGVLAIGGSSAMTYALLTSRKSATNQIQIADVTANIEETYNPSDPTPGKTIIKAPRVKNTSNVNVYVRARVRFSNSDMEKMCNPLDINSAWTAGGDGYYYYGSQVAPGAYTTNIFEKVIVRSNVTQQQIDDAGLLDIFVYAEAVQAKNYPSAQVAFDAHA